MLQKAVISSFLFLRGFLPATATAAQEPAKPKAEAEHQYQFVEQPPLPSCVYCPNPEFPGKARKAKISSARAVLEVTVLENGNVDPHDILVIQDPGKWVCGKSGGRGQEMEVQASHRQKWQTG